MTHEIDPYSPAGQQAERYASLARGIARDQAMWANRRGASLAPGLGGPVRMPGRRDVQAEERARTAELDRAAQQDRNDRQAAREGRRAARRQRLTDYDGRPVSRGTEATSDALLGSADAVVARARRPRAVQEFPDERSAGTRAMLTEAGYLDDQDDGGQNGDQGAIPQDGGHPLSYGEHGVSLDALRLAGYSS